MCGEKDKWYEASKVIDWDLIKVLQIRYISHWFADKHAGIDSATNEYKSLCFNLSCALVSFNLAKCWLIVLMWVNITGLVVIVIVTVYTTKPILQV